MAAMGASPSPLSSRGLGTGVGLSASGRFGRSAADNSQYHARVAGASFAYDAAADAGMLSFRSDQWLISTDDASGKLRLGFSNHTAVVCAALQDVADGRRDAADVTWLAYQSDFCGSVEVIPSDGFVVRAEVSYPFVSGKVRYLRHREEIDWKSLPASQRDGLGLSVEAAWQDEKGRDQLATGVAAWRVERRPGLTHLLGWGNPQQAVQLELFVQAKAGGVALRAGYDPAGRKLRMGFGLGF